MKTYFFNPAGDLIVYNTDKRQLLILERVEHVKVFTNGDIRCGGFDGDEIAAEDLKIKPLLFRHRKVCGDSGHRRNGCPKRDTT